MEHRCRLDQHWHFHDDPRLHRSRPEPPSFSRRSVLGWWFVELFQSRRHCEGRKLITLLSRSSLVGLRPDISLPSLPTEFSCRVELNGRVLEVVSAGSIQEGPRSGPKWMALQHASEVSLTVEVTPLATEDDLHYWEHTSDPAQFRAYIEDLDTGQLLSGVTIS